MNNTDSLGKSRRVARSKPLWMASMLLVGGLALAGCATSTTDTASSESSSSTSPTSTASTVDSPIATTSSGSEDATTTAETIADTNEAVEAFLATLSEEQVEAVTYDYDDETKTTSWSNYPVTFVERAGLNLADLTEEQQTAAMAVLEALLSDEAYETVTNIMGGDQYLLENSDTTETSLGQYYLAFFGDASDTDAYAVQFGGHHLGINADLNGAEDTITFAPTHLGVQPAVYTDEDGDEVQPFDGIYTDAFAFFDSLTPEQQETLTSGDVTMCAPGDTCDFESGSGLTGADLTDEQKQLLLELIANWAGMADEETTASTLAEIEATLDETVIAWSGETTYDMSTGDGINFSISGPDVYIAFQAQSGSAGADVEGVSTSGWGHVHTIYRDPSNDYANSVEQQAATGGMGGGAPDGGARGDGQMPSGEPPADAPSS
ncbi:DUF3500 domain-containing protein [Microbacterium oryzae]|uniref:DUF3500 domain-containing protein n=1 Tax=Microbacterium oryzae TaxID=743009 RepID=UPI0025B00403|nr:DUF3500 domain-containing protein [Microbacterium oryzae]MDN3311325.1 DUF3500 domain-containing protein [Microbacterium oryzae]